MLPEFLKELFYNNPYSTDGYGYRYYVIEGFSNIYSLKVLVENEEYIVVSWKNESL
jgi:hypothetical protein